VSERGVDCGKEKTSSEGSLFRLSGLLENRNIFFTPSVVILQKFRENVM
jgi:hypothetical protein